MEIEVGAFIIVNGKNLTSRRLDVLSAIEKYGSKNTAAKKLRLSVPVVHKYISLMEKITESQLVSSTATGTKLTSAGKKLLKIYEMIKERCKDDRVFTISCSPVTENLIMHVISKHRLNANAIVSDDYTNINSLKRGYSDMIILDDPRNLEMVDNYNWSEIGYMDMIHVNRGSSYMRYKYGAQRIAYAHLDLIGKKYKIDGETCDISDLINSKKSFFVDEILLSKKGLKFDNSTNKKLLRHSITAVYCEEKKETPLLLKALQSEYYHLR
ncbi:MAG: LysR family transcriptional regulator [archaeon]|nr:LysR family transcriptional regulator [archaeon]